MVLWCTGTLSHRYMSSYIALDKKLKEKYGYYAAGILLQSYERKTFKHHERNMYLRLSFKFMWSVSKKWFEELPCWLSYYIWCYFLGIVLISSCRARNSYQINSNQSKVFWGADLKCMRAISLFFASFVAY